METRMAVIDYHKSRKMMRLTDEQHETLKTLAKKKKQTLSDVQARAVQILRLEDIAGVDVVELLMRQVKKG